MKKAYIKNTLFLAALFGTNILSHAMERNSLGMPGAMSISLTPQSQKQKKHSKKKQANLNKQLLKAVRKGYERRVKKLLENGAHVNARTGDRGETPLHHAVGMRRDPIVSLLITAGANVDAKDKYGMTPLHYAAMGWCTNSMRLLLAHGADVFSKQCTGDIPLGLIARRRTGDFIRWDRVGETRRDEKLYKECRENIKVFLTAPRNLLTCKEHKEQVEKMLGTTMFLRERTSWGSTLVLDEYPIMLSQAGMNMALQWCKEIEQAYEN